MGNAIKVGKLGRWRLVDDKTVALLTMRAEPLVAFWDRREPIHGDLDAAIRAATIPECDKGLASHLAKCQRIGFLTWQHCQSGGAVEVWRTINRLDGDC